MKKLYYKHTIIHSFSQDDVEQEINKYVKESGDINIISLNVIPEKWGSAVVGGYATTTYCYHISLVYTSNEE